MLRIPPSWARVTALAAFTGFAYKQGYAISNFHNLESTSSEVVGRLMVEVVFASG
jgi:hypothetical protein